MVKNSITVFARVKPEDNCKGVVNYKIHRRPKKHLNEDFLVLSSQSKSAKYIDNRPKSWNFSFHRIFEHDMPQEDVFESVARPVVNSVFDGYNATIFAYGQTGSGKTYTITGESGIHSERGILPRTLQYIFDIVRKNPENLYSVEVAYLEIYNENGYDLLLERKQRDTATRIEDLPRVTIQEDESGTMHLKNLSFRIVENEKEAFQFLINGDTYRATSETPMNPRSSRSHCIFTIVVSVKKFGADRYSRAKLHLVDLAGSERVYKCSIQGTILTEAKHINLSLHFLEQVIVCLSQDNVSHVPYRNSLLTSVLRDSLGGNCLTTMLATISVSSFNLEETISTCRFAQRVALVKNDVNLIFELDAKSENLLLRLENERLRKQIEEYQKQATETSVSETRAGSLEYYKNLVVQRDQEISHLIELLKKERSRRKSATKEVPRVLTNVSQDQNSIQITSSLISPRNIEQNSTTKLKKRGHANFLQGKEKMIPGRNESLNPQTMRKMHFQNPSPEVPVLDLNKDNADELSKTQKQPKLACLIDIKTERRENIVVESLSQRETHKSNTENLNIDDSKESKKVIQYRVVSEIAQFDGNLSKKCEKIQAIDTETETETNDDIVLETLSQRDTQTLNRDNLNINFNKENPQVDVNLSMNKKIRQAVYTETEREDIVPESLSQREVLKLSKESFSTNLKKEISQLDANLSKTNERRQATDTDTERKEDISESPSQRGAQKLNREKLAIDDDKESKKLVELRVASEMSQLRPNLSKKYETRQAIVIETERREDIISESPDHRDIEKSKVENQSINDNTKGRQTVDTETETSEAIISESLSHREIKKANAENLSIDDNKKSKKVAEFRVASKIAQPDASVLRKTDKRNAERDSQTLREEILIAINNSDKTESNLIQQRDKISEKKSPREKSPGLGFPQNVMKMIRTSGSRQGDDKAEISSPKSETSRGGFKTSNILRSMLCKEKNSSSESVARVEDKKLNESAKKEEAPKIINNRKKPLPLTGDPEIDEEIIAFYKAKRLGGTY